MAHEAPIEASEPVAEAAQAQAPQQVGPPGTAEAPKPGSYADGHGAWWVPTWYILLCALPLAGAFFLPVPLIMVMRASRPPIDFITAAWIAIGVGWALWLFAAAAWLVAGWLFKEHGEEIDEMAAWWRRTTQMWLLLVLAWGAAATIGIWVFYLVVGHTIGLDSVQ